MVDSGVTLFFEKNIITVFLVYGLSLFFIASSILLSYRALKKMDLFHVFLSLFLFSIIHGTMEWIDMYNHYNLLMHDRTIGPFLSHIRFYLLLVSFCFLLLFGINLILRNILSGRNMKKYVYIMNVTFLLSTTLIMGGLLMGDGILKYGMEGMETFVRYLLGFPSALLAGVALYRLSTIDHSSALPQHHQWYLRYTAYCFILYGFLTGIVVPEGHLFLAPWLNQDIFLQYTGVPVQLFRGVSITAIAFFMMRAMAIRILYKQVATYIIIFTIPVILAGSGYINLKLIEKSYKEVEKIGDEEKYFYYLNSSFNRLNDIVRNTDIHNDREIILKLVNKYVEDFGVALNHVTDMEHDHEREIVLISEISEFFNQSFKNGIENYRIEDIERLNTMVQEISAIHTAEVMAHREEVLDNTRIYKQALYAASIASFLILLLILYSSYKMIVLPLNQLKTGAREISDGNLNHRIDVRTGDELQEFASDFNTMGARLLERTEKLEATSRELQELSIRDGLTGLFNHRYFYSKLMEEINRSERYGKDVSLLMMDVDDFKHFNDTHGHQMGDKVLLMIGEIMRRSLRETDIICRYGGEELVAVLPETGKAEAMICAERLRLTIERSGFSGEERQPNGCLTLTMGVASYPHDSLESDGLVRKADEALYRAKREGKNRVYTSGLPVKPGFLPDNYKG